MPSPEPSVPATARPLDAVALGRVQRRLLSAAQPPWLHGEVARRMARRLPVVRLQPQRVADWGAFLGASHELLAQAYPRARVMAVEADAARRDATAAALVRPWWSPRRWSSVVSVVTEREVGAGQVQLLWANMGLHGAIDPAAVLRQWHRALAVDGFLMFSTLGPGTLTRLRSVYTHQGWATPFAPFVDMHDLGDLLVEAGFADPVMDQETVTLTWASATALLDELRTLGGNVATGRHAGLRTPRWRRRLLDALAATAAADGRVALDFEVVYGHAFRPPPRPRLAARTEVPLDDMRAMARAGRKAG
ncbi:MAG: biotin synthase [Rubrivivax sp.]|nr:biotin synthase [Rubrivivax sp.]